MEQQGLLPPLSERGLEILQIAVTLARNEQIGRLSQLKERLLQRFPGQEDEIASAIKFWAAVTIDSQAL